MSLLIIPQINISLNANANKWHRYTIKIILNWFSKINKIHINDDNAIINDDNAIINVSINDIFERSTPADKIIIISGENKSIIPDNCALFITTNDITCAHGNNVIYIPQLYLSLHEHRKSIDPNDYINLHTNFCAYMYSISCEHMIRVYNLLNGYKPVASLGKCRPDGSKEVQPSSMHVYNDTETYNDIAIDMYSNGGFKFIIAMENSTAPGYSTEKLINPIIANCIPIYWGDAGIFKYINKKRVIYIPDYDDAGLIERIKYLDENSDAFNEVIAEPCFLISPEEIYTKYSNDISYALSEL